MSVFETITDVEARVKVSNAVNEGVQIKHAIDTLKQHAKDIAEAMKEDYEIGSADFNKLVTAVYKADVEQRKRELSDLEFDVQIVFTNSNPNGPDDSDESGSEDE